jgi:hypothetical protein
MKLIDSTEHCVNGALIRVANGQLMPQAGVLMEVKWEQAGSRVRGTNLGRGTALTGRDPIPGYSARRTEETKVRAAVAVLHKLKPQSSYC